MKILKRGYIYVDWNKIKDEEDYKNKRNQIYYNLLNGVSITRFFFENKKKICRNCEQNNENCT